MTDSDKHLTIGILNYPGAQLSAIYGLQDLFRVANSCHAEDSNDHQNIRVEILDMQSQTPQDNFTAIIFPPSLEDGGENACCNIWSDWILSAHRHGTLLCSVCAGTFWLAETGILNGRPATTHWAFTASFASQFPDVLIDTDKMIIDDNDIITAGGVMAWQDLGLRLTERLLGTVTMLSVASFFLISPGGREQRYFSSFSPSLAHGDRQIVKVQHWLQLHCSENIAVKDLSKVASLTERTLLRRFKKTTGHNPSEYIQQLRTDKAKQILRTSNISIEDVAWKVGYKDSTAFRRTFLKITGLTPREYRNRFSSMDN